MYLVCVGALHNYVSVILGGIYEYIYIYIYIYIIIYIYIYIYIYI